MKSLLLWFTATLRWVGRQLRRVSRLLYIVLVTLIVGVLWLVMTTSGAQWLAERAMAEEERLELRVTGGSLWNGLEIQQLSWRDTGVDVGVRQAELRWNHLCLLQRRVCLDLAAVRGVDVRVDTDALPDPEEDDVEAAAEQGDPFPLPIDLSFPDIRIQKVDATVDDHRVRWSELRMGGELTGSTLRVRQFNWETILVELAEQEDELVTAEEADDDAPGLLETGWEPLDLPEVQLPLKVVVEDLRLHDLRVVQGEELFAVQRFSIAGGLRGTDLVLTHLEAVHKHGQLLADGTIKLEDDWPLDLDVHLDARELPEIGDLELRAQLWNSIGDLEFAADAQGLAEVHIRGAAAPGKKDLPMRLEGNWDALQWPLETGELVVSRGGKLHLEGDLSDYELALETDLSGQDIPPGHWELLAHGDLAHVRVERLRGEILEGSLEISGQAQWHPQIAWQADARLEGLAPDTLYAEAPTRVTGGLSTSGQLVDGDL
ncbi:hypothetical protein, partial [Aquisalimonas sp.]|uniref:hypothetical protein n=1 Tax=Aquisalimonas sp. TaxID=1872621 RepID=UPI0025BCA5EA